MLVEFSFITFVYPILSLQYSSFALAINCGDNEEVLNFIKGPEYYSLYSYNANLSKSVKPIIYSSAEDSLEYSSSVKDILPENATTYLRRRPPQFCGHTTNAVFHITILSLDSINESDMTYTVDCWLTIGWIDERLRFPESDRDFRLLDVTWLEHLWKPDVVFKNARLVTVHDQIDLNQGLRIFRNKALILLTKLTLSLTCPMSFEKYPHDVQICDMKMESMQYTQSELTFSWDKENPVSIRSAEEPLKTPQFKIAKIETNHCSDPDYTSGSFACVRIIFYLQRSLGYHIIHTYIPSGSVVVLSWITFWMKPEAIAARFGLGVTSLLTLVTLNTQSQENLPPESYAKAIDVWMMSCALFVFGSIIEFAIVNYLVCRFSENATENIIKTRNTDKFLYRIRAVFTNDRIHAICHNIDRVSRCIFPLNFVFLNIWYWTTHLNTEGRAKLMK